MRHLPETTYYGKRMPKEKFYAHLQVSAAVKRSFVEDIECFIWRNKLSETTVNVVAGERVKEIALIEVHLKREEHSLELFEFIDRNISVYVVYLLRFDNRVRLLVNYKEPVANKSRSFKVIEGFASDWVREDEVDLRIEGLDLDAVYDGFVRQVAGRKLHQQGDAGIAERIDAQQLRAKIERQIAQLETRRRNEKQFNKQLEIAAEIKKLKEQRL